MANVAFGWSNDETLVSGAICCAYRNSDGRVTKIAIRKSEANDDSDEQAALDLYGVSGSTYTVHAGEADSEIVLVIGGAS